MPGCRHGTCHTFLSSRFWLPAVQVHSSCQGGDDLTMLSAQLQQCTSGQPGASDQSTQSLQAGLPSTGAHTSADKQSVQQPVQTLLSPQQHQQGPTPTSPPVRIVVQGLGHPSMSLRDEDRGLLEQQLYLAVLRIKAAVRRSRCAAMVSLPTGVLLRLTWQP